MNFIHNNLGHQRQGAIVEFTLTAVANVRLLDATNFREYSEDRPAKFFGGQATQTPTHVAVPYAGHWHAVIDLEGLSGSVRGSARVLPRR